MKVILIDPSRESMAGLRRMLAAALPDVEVTEYDPEQAGAPPSGFRWSLYDVLLIQQDLGGAETGLLWIGRYRQHPGFPPAILLARQGDDYLAVRAIREGATDFLLADDLTPERLLPMVRSAALMASGRRAQAEGEQTLEGTREDREPLLRELRAGTVPGAGIGYRFLRLIGQGAHSRVYLGEPQAGGAPVVIKVISLEALDEPRLRHRFEREAELMSALESPYVVRYLSHGFTSTHGYLVMEFFPHGDLKQRLEQGIPPPLAVDYLTAIARGLEAIHALDVVHRDLKPGNIMFRADDSLALADFGVSRRIEEALELTRAGSVIGTPNYLAPEQARGLPADHRSDLYSAGVIFFEMLTRRKPYRGENAAAVLYRHVHEPVPRLPASLARFQPLIDRLLAKSPDARPPDAAALLAMLATLAPEAKA